MKAVELARWVETAREAGASHIEVRRTKQSGSGLMFSRDAIVDLDVERLVERMREDLRTKQRRLSHATFDVLAYRVEGKDERLEVMRDAVAVSRDDDDDTKPAAEGMNVESASVEMQRAAFKAASEAHRDMRDGMMSAMQVLQNVASDLSTKLVESQDKTAQVMGIAFEFSTLRHEREESARASAERRELGKVAIEEFAPLFGAALTHITKQATPAWAGFAKRLQTSGKLPAILELLGPEETAALGAALDITFPSKAKETTAEAVKEG